MVVAVLSAAEGARTTQVDQGVAASQQQQQFNSTQPATADTPAQLARQASGLCRLHFRYGDKAYSCGGNFTWQGN